MRASASAGSKPAARSSRKRADSRTENSVEIAITSALSAADIGPNRLNLTADVTPAGRLRGRLQSFTYFDRSFTDGSGDVTASDALAVMNAVGSEQAVALFEAEGDDRSETVSAGSVLTAVDADRSGYVPNVVYTCGALCVGERLLLPYGISDSAVGFATVTIDNLLAVLS